MTLPQLPHHFYSANYYPPHPWAPAARRPRVATWDIICTALLSAVLLMAGFAMTSYSAQYWH